MDPQILYSKYVSTILHHIISVSLYVFVLFDPYRMLLGPLFVVLSIILNILQHANALPFSIPLKCRSSL